MSRPFMRDQEWSEGRGRRGDRRRPLRERQRCRWVVRESEIEAPISGPNDHEPVAGALQVVTEGEACVPPPTIRVSS
jgi:hypothetical protein